MAGLVELVGSSVVSVVGVWGVACQNRGLVGGLWERGWNGKWPAWCCTDATCQGAKSREEGRNVERCGRWVG